MDIINLSNINVDSVSEINGTYAIVKKCKYNGKTYAYKNFMDFNYFDKRYNRLNVISEAKIDGCLLPKYFVYDNLYNKRLTGYLMDYFDSYTVKYLRKLDFNLQIELLKDYKKIITNMHKNKMVHGDLHCGNLLVSPKTLEVKIADFDNCSYKRYTIVKRCAFEYSQLYMNRYGVNEGLDIFLFNILTYNILNNVSYFDVRRHIYVLGEYGVFNSTKKEKYICNSLLLDFENYNTEYLLDAYLEKNKRKM